MRYQLELFFTALGFFTRIPVPAWVPWSSERMSHAARYFALVGWVVGAAGALGYLALASLLPPAVAVILSMALTIRLTGAFHEDGFADSCDGLGGGWDKAQVLAIMKDSRIGSYGAIGLVLMLLAKAAALIELASAGPAAAAIALFVAHALSRLAATAVLHALPYARSDDGSKAAAVVRRLGRNDLAIAAACGLLPALVLLAPLPALAVLSLAALLTVWLARLCLRRLGGHTGDLSIERVDLQLHIPLRIDFSDALLQSCDTFRIRVDDHQHRTTIVGCDSSRQFLHGPSQHFDGDFGHFHGSVFIAIRRQQRQQEVGEQQGYDDHATCDEDQFVTHGEPHASRNGVRDREHQ